ncbi:MAG: lipid A deacylase LpxR family protein [Shimia sp.]|nr:lipid A deacylase LpxR family protein [Shimia sp.]
MLRRIAAFMLGVVLSAQGGTAAPEAEKSSWEIGGREYLGFGSMFVNDLLGDGKDRWRTGSYGTSRFWGYGWNGQLPAAPGDLIELRIGGEILSPASLTKHMPMDRPWAGMLSAGLHTQFQRQSTEFSMGGDILALGPQTGLDHLQGAIHDLFGFPGPSDEVRANQIPNKWMVRFVGEAGRDFELGGQASLRPFVETRLGDENLVRAGVDFTLGQFGRGELMSRDWVTGNRYRSGPNQEKGVSFVVGADVAKVFSSVYLPKDRGYDLTDLRTRVRAGVHWQGKKHHLFYGLTYLSEEFEMQYEGQVVGAIRLDFHF